MRGKGRINKTWRLLHVFLFIKCPIYIYLPTTGNHNEENQPNSGLLNDRTKSLKIINTFLSSKTSSNQLSFIVLNDAIYTIFYLVHPTTTNNIHQRIRRNQKPSAIETQHLNLILYSIVPSLIPVSIRKYNRFIGMRREYLRDKVVRQS